MKNQILEFINRRWSNTDGNWFNGNCYYFAVILHERFRKLKIYYLPIQGHFVVGDGSNFYDASGELNLDEEPMLFSQIKKEDPMWYERLIKYCVN